MAQIFRAAKIDSLCLVRNYGTQRGQQNYYEVLRVSPNSTQKEIRQAFIKLSKQMHPDITGKKDHRDFVRMNEAYTVLSKPNTRQQYDINLKYNYSYDTYHENVAQQKQNYYYNYNHYYPHFMYMNRKEWEARMRGTPGPDTPDPMDRPEMIEFTLIVCFTILIFGSLIQMIVLRSPALHNGKRNTVIYDTYEAEQKRVEETMEGKTQLERLKIFIDRFQSPETGERHY